MSTGQVPRVDTGTSPWPLIIVPALSTPTPHTPPEVAEGGAPLFAIGSLSLGRGRCLGRHAAGQRRRLSTCPWARLLGRGDTAMLASLCPRLGSSSYWHQHVSGTAQCSRAAVVESELLPFIQRLDQSPIERDKPVSSLSFLFSFSRTCSPWDHCACGPRTFPPKMASAKCFRASHTPAGTAPACGCPCGAVCLGQAHVSRTDV